MSRLSVFGGVLVSLLLGTFLQALFGSGSDRAYTDPSGTWYVVVEIDEQRAIPEIVTFHQDGRYNFTVPGGASGYGEWVKTASHDVEAIALQLNVDESTGRLESIEEGRGVLHFSKDFDLFKGRIFAVEYKCDGPFDCPFPLTDQPDRKMTPDEGLLIKGMRLGTMSGESRFESF